MDIASVREKAKELRETVLVGEELGLPALIALAIRFRIIFCFGEPGVEFSEAHGHWILRVSEDSLDRGDTVFILACGIGGILLETDERDQKETFARSFLIPEKSFLLALKSGIHEEDLSVKYSVPVSVIRERKKEVEGVRL